MKCDLDGDDIDWFNVNNILYDGAFRFQCYISSHMILHGTLN